MDKRDIEEQATVTGESVELTTMRQGIIEYAGDMNEAAIRRLCAFITTEMVGDKRTKDKHTSAFCTMDTVKRIVAAAKRTETLLCDRCERDMTEEDIRVGLNDGVVCPECQHNEQLTKTELLAEADAADDEALCLEDQTSFGAAVAIRALWAWARRLRIEAH